MTTQYHSSDLKKMTMSELSVLIGYDYQDFMAAGGTSRDALAIANDRKTLQDVLGENVSATSGELSAEDLVKIRKRPDPALTAVIYFFAMIVFIIVFYSGATLIGLPDVVVFLLMFMLPIGFIVWRGTR